MFRASRPITENWKSEIEEDFQKELGQLKTPSKWLMLRYKEISFWEI